MSRVSKQVIIKNEDTGEIISNSITHGTQNGDGWMIMYREAISLLIDEVPDFSTLKVFLKLASKQEFEGGLKISKKFIADELGISRTQSWRAFKWLKENGYIKERKVNGLPEFLLNPKVATCGKNRKAKIALWESN